MPKAYIGSYRERETPHYCLLPILAATDREMAVLTIETPSSLHHRDSNQYTHTK